MQDRSGINVLFEILIFYRIAVTVMPIIGIYVPSYVNIATFLLLFFIVVVKLSVFKTMSIAFRSLGVFLIELLGIVYAVLIEKTGGFVDQTYVLLMYLLWPLIAYIIVRDDMQKEAGYILLWTAICIIITCVTTYVGNIIFPGASRHMSNGSYVNEETSTVEMFKSFNIATFTFIYDIVILTPLTVYFIKNSRSLAKIVALIMLIATALVLIKTEYTTAILLFILGVSVFLMPKSFGYGSIIKLFITCISLYLIVPVLFDWIIHVSGSEQVADRLGSILSLFRGEAVDSSSDLALRIELWQKSLNYFVDNPLLGTGNLSGGHSFVLDTIAKFGLLGISGLIVVYKFLWNNIKTSKDTNIAGYFIVTYILNLIQSIVNPMNDYWVFTFIIPVLTTYLIRNSIREN